MSTPTNETTDLKSTLMQFLKQEIISTILSNEQLIFTKKETNELKSEHN